MGFWNRIQGIWHGQWKVYVNPWNQQVVVGIEKLGSSDSHVSVWCKTADEVYVAVAKMRELCDSRNKGEAEARRIARIYR